MAKSKPNAPLTPAVLHVLLALSKKERHGYGIMKQVESDSQGKVSMGPGTLYGSIRRMIKAGLIRESDKAIDLKWTTSGGSITGLLASAKKPSMRSCRDTARS